MTCASREGCLHCRRGRSRQSRRRVGGGEAAGAEKRTMPFTRGGRSRFSVITAPSGTRAFLIRAVPAMRLFAVEGVVGGGGQFADGRRGLPG